MKLDEILKKVCQQILDDLTKGEIPRTGICTQFCFEAKRYGFTSWRCLDWFEEWHFGNDSYPFNRNYKEYKLEQRENLLYQNPQRLAFVHKIANS